MGSFFRVVVLQDRNKKSQNLSEIWQGNNLTFEGLQQVLQSIAFPSEVGKKQINEPSPEEVKKDWNRLASFMSKNQ